jgi:4-alpha-glucanotransferase
MTDRDVAELANAAGLSVNWDDAAGGAKTVSPDSLRAILSALHLPCETASQVRDSRARLTVEAGQPPKLVVATSGRDVSLPGVTGKVARIVLETGEHRDVDLAATPQGCRFRAPKAVGYHRLEVGDASMRLAIAPRCAHAVGRGHGCERPWGSALQVYAARDKRGEAFGDFSAVAAVATALAQRGCDALAISPVHAQFPADPSRISPYAPSSRLFMNGLYADPAVVFPRRWVSDAEAVQAELIDWESAIPQKLARLRRLYERFSAEPADVLHERFEMFRRRGGDDLEAHARFDALQEHFSRGGPAPAWQAWPVAFRDRRSSEVARFAAEHRSEVDFHIFLQWLADESLAEAQRQARAAGMSIGLIADLAVGMDAGGSHAWSRPGDVLAGLAVGAPPDIFQPEGQNWGLTNFAPSALKATGYQPFIATLRAAMQHAGGVRIDHAMGLRRLWLVPEGAAAADGAYLNYPFEDMLRLLCLESVRAEAIVLAEDLGTVPDGFRSSLGDASILGMQVLWFERDDDSGAFRPPAEWLTTAAALTTTHDLPTVAGWYSGRDVDWRTAVNPASDDRSEQRDRAERAADRALLWRGCTEAGTGEGPAPRSSDTAPIVDAAVAYVAATPSPLAIITLEDLLADREQPNLPGLDGHPNWRRRLSHDIEFALRDAATRRRIQRISDIRSEQRREARNGS